MHVRADGEALVTGSADKDVKFWKFEHNDATDGSVSTEMVMLTLAFTYSLSL
jgi:U3 small nucleolar RNA-associated protein 12